MIPVEPWHVIAGGAVTLGGVLWWLRSRRVELSAWTGLSAIMDTSRAIATAKAAGVSRLSVFVNDLAFTSGPWRTYAPSDIMRAADAIRSAGLGLTLCSWLTPAWVESMASFGELGVASGADELEFDLEGPWVSALQGASDERVDELAERTFSRLQAGGWRRRVAADCIVGTDLRVVGPMVRRSDIVYPQAYRVAANRNVVEVIERMAVERFKPLGAEVGLGVAAYEQSKPFVGGRPDVLDAALRAGRALGVRRFRLWRLEFMDAALSAVARQFAGVRDAVA